MKISLALTIAINVNPCDVNPLFPPYHQRCVFIPRSVARCYQLLPRNL